MRLARALEGLIEVEERMAAFYGWAASCFAQDEAARRCFESLSGQERGHANQLGLQLRMVKSGKLEA